MKKIFNVISFDVVRGNLEKEYYSDGGWIQYLPAKKKATISYCDENFKNGIIEVEAGETLEFVPIGYDFVNELNIGNIEIK